MMKTPPIQQKQSAAPQQEAPGMESEGKSLAPPAFQLKASSDIAAAKPIQRKVLGTPGVLTITNDTAYLRDGSPSFISKGTTIAQGTRVVVLEEKKGANGTFIRVKNYDTDEELGWTSKTNVTDLDKKYKNGAATYNYHVGGYDLLVFVPKDGIKKTNPDVFMFFHGNGGDYTTAKTHTPGTDEFTDNPAISGKIPDAVSNSGSIAICPQGHNFHMDGEWGSVGAGKFKAMVDATLTHLSHDLGSEKPLTAGNISLAGHSAGGAALGQAALDTDANDVTLQEAGYNFDGSWKKLRKWFLLGKGPKTARVITQGNKKGAYTRKPVNDGGILSASEIVNSSQELADKKLLEGPVTVEEFQGEEKTEAGGIVLERGYRVKLKNGTLQGSLRLYHLADAKADHWAASSQTMETSMTSGAVDRAADQEPIKK
jgi:hypothetical protein